MEFKIGNPSYGYFAMCVLMIYGTIASGDRAYEMKIGECTEHDTTNGFDISLQDCVAICEDTVHCRSFTYLVETSRPFSPDRCRIKKHRCEKTSTKRWMTLLTFNKKESSEDQKPTSIAAKLGYMVEAGNCIGYDINSGLGRTLDDCAALCWENSSCTGFSYVVAPMDTSLRCMLKDALCDTLQKEDGKNILTFRKTSTSGGELSLETDVPGYKKEPGVCLKYNLDNIRAGLKECSGACTLNVECKSFVYVFKTKNPWPHARCWLKKNICGATVLQEGKIVYTYTKNSLTASRYVSVTGTKTVAAASEKEFEDEVETNIDAPGFDRKIGACQGQNLHSVRESFPDCAASCAKKTECLSFVYVFNSTVPWNYPSCWMKTSTCDEVVSKQSLKVYTYTKSTSGGTNTREKKQVKMKVCPKCQNGGRCVSGQCRCKPGYRGKTCSETVITSQGAKYKCKCRPGFTGKVCQTKTNYCANSPCLNGGTCSEEMRKCKCIKGYRGYRCEIDPCKKKSCQNGGSCIVVSGLAKCSCSSGYCGSRCERKPNEEGKCKTPVNGYKCECKVGYTGDQCQEKLDHCMSNPCHNGGKCINKEEGYECKCVPGYSGQRCEVDIDECKPKPCQNKGICVDKVNGFVCRCHPGFAGKTCEINIDECSSDPCKNLAKCIDKVNGYVCKCKQGFAGLHCENKVKDCKTEVCLNGGTCTLKKNKIKCVCPKGFNGKRCQDDVDECLRNPCLNGGECKNTIGSYKCKCKSGFVGTTCSLERNECEGQPCKNGGLCRDGIKNYTCSCKAGFSGKKCEIDIDECANEPCGKHGACVDEVNGYICKCVPGYTGEKCEINVNECASSPCFNGGTCIDGINGYNCTCAPGFTGLYCDKRKSSACPEDYCKNQGVCIALNGSYTCKCKSGFTGSRCDSELEETTAVPSTQEPTEAQGSTETQESTDAKGSTETQGSTTSEGETMTSSAGMTTEIPAAGSTQTVNTNLSSNVSQESTLSEGRTTMINLSKETEFPTTVSTPIVNTNLTVNVSEEEKNLFTVEMVSTPMSVSNDRSIPKAEKVTGSTQTVNTYLSSNVSQESTLSEGRTTMRNVSMETEFPTTVSTPIVDTNLTVNISEKENLFTVEVVSTPMSVSNDSSIPKAEKVTSVMKTVTKTYSKVKSVPKGEKTESENDLKDEKVVIEADEVTSSKESTGKSEMVTKGTNLPYTALPSKSESTNETLASIIDSVTRSTPETAEISTDQAETYNPTTSVNGKTLDYAWERPAAGKKLDSMEASAFGDVGGLDTRRMFTNGEIAAIAGGLSSLLLLLGMVLICALDRRNRARYYDLKSGQRYDPLPLEEDTEKEDFEARNRSNNAARTRRLMQYRPGRLRPEEMADMLSDSSCEVPDAVTSDEDEFQP